MFLLIAGCRISKAPRLEQRYLLLDRVTDRW